MLRICMIAYSEYVSDARIRREAESLAQRGDSVDLICLPHQRLVRRSVLRGVRILPVNMKRYRGSSTYRYLLSYLRFFSKAFVRVTLLHLRSRYDLVQVHTMPDFMVFAAVVPRFTGTGVLLDVHDLMPELYMSKFKLNRSHRLIRTITCIERASIGFAHRAIAVHSTHLEALVGHGNPLERFEVLLNTPDPSVFVPQESHGIRGGFKLVYHGTISRRHGLELALRAVALARNWRPELRFSIIGDGDDMDRLTQLATELDLDGSVEFTKRSVPVNELPGLLADADLGIVPLRKDGFTKYMLPVKLMEYVALGIPVIVTRTKTIEHYFRDSMVEYISGESVEELAQSIMSLAANPGRRADMAARACQFAKHYSWAKQKLEYYRLVDSIARRRNGARGPTCSNSGGTLRRADVGQRAGKQRSATSGGP